MEQNERQLILKVEFSEETNQYFVDSQKGMTVGEMVFGMAVAMKCLVKSGTVKSVSELEQLLHKYLTDPQYEELEDKTDE